MCVQHFIHADHCFGVESRILCNHKVQELVKEHCSRSRLYYSTFYLNTISNIWKCHTHLEVTDTTADLLLHSCCTKIEKYSNRKIIAIKVYSLFFSAAIILTFMRNCVSQAWLTKWGTCIKRADFFRYFFLSIQILMLTHLFSAVINLICASDFHALKIIPS